MARADETALSDHYIEFRNVSKAFDERVVLNDVSFYVDQGQCCVILGRSGVGKSVTLKHILGFLKPDSGSVFVAGEDITGWTEEQMGAVRRRVTMVFQSGALFDSLTVAENVAYPLVSRGDLDDAAVDMDEIDGRVAELLKLLEVAEYADRLPAELSTGMRRAVAIARALAQEPEAILYDEPTTMVDPIMAAHISELISRLKSTVRKTSVVVTHDTHLARKLADSVVFLHEGRAKFFGPWHDFESSSDPILQNFLLQDALVPALDHSL
ncbi:MAG: ATP-binding cassette domain-containing protein [Acidipila sp.]|nr:ATP-binding cassette domain-containing protein [Acidipila sp.]